MDKSSVQWSDLPPELWTVVTKHLHTYIDVLRCRAVCRSWRASLPPFNAFSPLLPLHVPCPPNDDAHYRIKDTVLIRKIIYRLSPLQDHQTPNSVSSSSSSSSSSYRAKGWFAMVRIVKKGKLRFLRPLYRSYLRNTYDSLRKQVNLHDFRIHEVAKSYELVDTNGIFVSGIKKVVMFPDSPRIDANNCTVLAMYEDGKLGFAKVRDHEWTLIRKPNFNCGDVIACRGHFYVVDRRAKVFRMDSSTMELVQISPRMRGSGKQKHLVECEGEVYVVDQFDKNSEVPEDSDKLSRVDFKVYRVCLDGTGRLEEVKNLGKKAFVLGAEGSFSVSERDFEGIKGNCIYYPRALSGVMSSIVHVFDVEERILKCDNDEEIFRLPLMLLDHNASHGYGITHNLAVSCTGLPFGNLKPRVDT